MPTSLNKYLDPPALDETVLNIRQIAEQLEADMQDLPYARPDGIYPEMTVGSVIGADETAQWVTRESTGTGSATVRSVHGATVAWNQLCDWFRATQTVNGVTFTNNGDGSVTLSGTATKDAYLTAEPQVINGHKYMFRGCPQGGSASTYYGYLTMRGFQPAVLDTGNGNFGTCNQDGDARQIIYVKPGTTCDNVTFWPQLFDLTKIFGSGNEPTTVAEFEAMYPLPYYPYSAPTLKPVQIAGIASTDAQGGELDAIEWPTQTLRAAGSVADVLYSDHVEKRVGVVDLGTLNWTKVTDARLDVGYDFTAGSTLFAATANKACAAYNVITDKQGLPAVIAAYGSAIDDVMFSSSSGNVYVVDSSYTDAAAFKAAMSGVYLFYELATPTTQHISPALPMTYRVEQGGTEAIIVPTGEISAAPVLTVAELINAGDEFARIWEAIQSLGYTRNTAQLSRPVSLTDVGTIDETQEVTKTDQIKEVQE